MTVIEFSTTIGCPVRCAFCPQTAVESAYAGPRLMTLDTFRRCLAHSPANVPIVFAGFAEPFLNRDTIRMIEHAAADHEIQVYTTCVGMNAADVMGLAKFQPKSITLHLADAEGYAKIRVDERYIDTVAAVSALPNVNVMTMGTLHPSLVPIFGDVPPHPMHSRAGNVGGMVRLSKPGPLKCGAAPNLDHPVVLPDGRTVLCCSDWSMEHVTGNLAERPWSEIHAGEGISDVRRRMESGRCLCNSCEYSVQLKA